ncbi:hypothetical protein HIM_08292 [Hirsutella minnesotensis 3608]|uniref:ATP-grasp domain-containing protein n=1 Tax=Hirsutella minnesotensis 3608 TaxID=1043627 RepID=A0A0F7ZHB8_9HYPO|nr:hypothetical protein HIM_08292 [Hirsutella minnesotensis 3608]
MGRNIPQITLDTTLANLYPLDGGNPDDISLVLVIPPPGQVSSSLPENTKFVYQNPIYDKLDNDIYARILLAACPQYLGFVAGSMPLNLFDIDKTTYESWLSLVWKSVPRHQVDARRVYDVLAPAQRPRLGFISVPEHFNPNTSSGEPAHVVVNTPLDCLSQHPGIITSEVHYQLLSKYDLAKSSLPTPPSNILTTSITPIEVEDDVLVEAESNRFVEAVKKRALPFVLKFPSSLAGHGVFILRTDSERDACLASLHDEVAQMIRSLNASNAHLSPVSLILQDMLPGEAVAHSLFVTKTGRAIFIACCEQVINDSGFWSGAVTDYKRQGELEKLYAPTADKIAKHVYSKGYYGPVGADIMISGGEQLIIDLNVRLTGSYILGLMKGHFSDRRGLHFASLLSPVPVRGDRDAFETRFAQELIEGRLVIVGWCCGRGGPGGLFKYSIGSIVIGGEDKAALMELVERVHAIMVKQ